MLRILSSHRKLCTGLTRRDLLQAGGLGVCGLTLGGMLESHALQAASTWPPRHLARTFGKAKQCILLFLYGSPSQLETFDMKPHAPAEIRGTMQPIASALPGLDVCEGLPNLARVMDRVTVLRSLTHPYPIHGVAYATTGVPAIDVAMELSPHDPRHHPYFGSALEYALHRHGQSEQVPQNMALPFPFSSQREGEVYRAGPYASYLGNAFNPTWTDFVGDATGTVAKTLRDIKIDCADPYVGCTADSRFQLAATQPQPGLTIDRLNRRRSLLEQFEQARQDLDETSAGQSLSKFQQMAVSLLNTPKVAESLDVRNESADTRDLYGMTLFGQACLAGRRLLQAGTRLVSVFWDEYGVAGDAWDTHWNHYPRMQNQLLPGFDKAVSGLILDLDDRGMLDETLVVCISEHGRTPKLNSREGGGRDHWSRAYSALFAGGGVARGCVVGATDKHAGDVRNRPISPKSVLATMYHLLGVDPHLKLKDRADREIPLVPESSNIIGEMLA